MKILIDSNVALDMLLCREPFYLKAAQIFGLLDDKTELFVSSSTITDIFYITSKDLKSKQAALDLLKDLLELIEIAAVTGSEIRRAIDLDWKAGCNPASITNFLSNEEPCGLPRGSSLGRF